MQKLSSDSSKGYQTIGHDASMSHGGFEIAALAAGASIALTDAALDGRITNGYALTR
jgi:acetoin utilization deacetylase AcuC-like enzyme